MALPSPLHVSFFTFLHDSQNLILVTILWFQVANFQKKQACIACKSYFFGWASYNGALCVHNVFIFVTEKEHYFQMDENIALLHLQRKKEKPNLSELAKVFCGLLSLLSQYFQAKTKCMFMWCNDWVCSDWTLDAVFLVRDGM